MSNIEDLNKKEEDTSSTDNLVEHLIKCMMKRINLRIL